MSTQKKYCNRCEKEKPATTKYWYKNNHSFDGLLGHCKECHKAYYNKIHAKDPEYNRAHSAAWRKLNPIRAYRNVVEWQKRHPQYQQPITANKMAKKLGVPGILTEQEIIEVFRQQEWRCYYCDVPHRKKKLTVDHVIGWTDPRCKNTKENIVGACIHCNSAKGKKGLEYLKQLAIAA